VEHSWQALSEREAASRLNLSVATLRAWRKKGKGPRFVRFGRAVRYIDSDVRRFIEASVVSVVAKERENVRVAGSEMANHESLEAGPILLD
jgi:excisionase family DNA binding protein